MGREWVPAYFLEVFEGEGRGKFVCGVGKFVMGGGLVELRLGCVARLWEVVAISVGFDAAFVEGFCVVFGVSEMFPVGCGEEVGSCEIWVCAHVEEVVVCGS